MGRTAKAMTRADAVLALHRAETRLLEDVLTAATGREVLQQVVDELGEVRRFLEALAAYDRCDDGYKGN